MTEKNKQYPCQQRTCQSREQDRSTSASGVANDEMRGRPVLYTGVVWIGLLRRFLIPRTCGSSLPPLPPEPPASARTMSHEPPPTTMDYPVDPGRSASQLRTQPALLNTKSLESPDGGMEWRRKRSSENSHSPLAALVSQVQEASAAATGHYRDLSRDISQLLREGRTTTSETMSVLRSEDAVQYRWTVITMSGLLGYLVGMKRGRVAKLVYCATGATAMATLCYPGEARHYNAQGLLLLREAVMYGIATFRDGNNGHRKGSTVFKGVSKDPDTLNSKTINMSNIKQTTLQQQCNKQPSNAKSTQDKSHSKNSNNSNINQNTIYEPRHQEKNTSKTPPLAKNLGNIDQNQQTINSQTNRNNYYSSELPQQGKLHNTPPHFIQESSVRTTDSGETLPNPGPNIGGRLSFECGKKDLPDNTIQNLPPPTFRYHKNDYTYTQTQHFPNQEQTPITETKNLSPHTYSSHTSLGTAEVQSDVHLQPITEDSGNRSSENRGPNIVYPLIPVPEPILVIEEENNATRQEDENAVGNVHPLNRKLSRYYIKKTDEIVASTGKGYEDLYTRRK